jgi:hypothetical protein
MEPEKICPFMSRPADKNNHGGFILCQKERCMAWVPEYRMTPIGLVQAHCKIMGLEGGAVAKPGGAVSPDHYFHVQDFD